VFNSFQFLVPLPCGQVCERLRVLIEPRQFGNGESFIGTLNGTSFQLRRHTKFFIPFMPVVSGSVVAVSGGCRVEARAALGIFPLFFFTIWLVGLMAATYSGLSNPEASRIGVLGSAICMLGFGLLTLYAPFLWEVRKSKELLVQAVARGGA
jgi:hypothetical protein